ncbi:MAG: hypothetical protein U5K75_10430 [Ahrensia sp.]|nr:hypothetical protein [Ahrensia sp.]
MVCQLFCSDFTFADRLGDACMMLASFARMLKAGDNPTMPENDETRQTGDDVFTITKIISYNA